MSSPASSAISKQQTKAFISALQNGKNGTAKQAFLETEFRTITVTMGEHALTTLQPTTAPLNLLLLRAYIH